MQNKNEEIIKEMNAYYSHRAPEHDSLMGYTGNKSMEELLHPVIEYIEDFIKGQDILEIACGTGNWTQVLAKRARSVLATDVNDNVLELARNKDFPTENVEFKVADAYTLDGIDAIFNAAFASDWFSHIPKLEISRFLNVLHQKLYADSHVVFIEMMNNEYFENEISHYDDEGNRISRRETSNGLEFNVIRNFPTMEELRDYLRDIAYDIDYHEDTHLLRWILKYRIKK